MKIDNLLEQFCEHSKYIKGYAPETIRRYRESTKLLCKLEGVENIEQINSDIVRSFFMQGRTERDWQPGTFITKHKSLVVFFRWCVQKGHMASNPAEEIELPRVPKKIPPKLTRQQAMEILEVAYNYPYDYRFLRFRNHAIFATFIFAGLRKQELLSLGYGDIDLDNMSLFVRQGKGSKDRVVPICQSLASTLNRYITERKRLNKDCPEFFTSLNRNKGFTDSGLKRLIVKIRTASGIPFYAHKLRHTFATLMLEGGCDIFSLSKMMGHSDIKTTTIYLAATHEHLRSQAMKHPLNNM